MTKAPMTDVSSEISVFLKFKSMQRNDMNFFCMTAAIMAYLCLKHNSKLTEPIEYCISNISHCNVRGVLHFVLFTVLVNLPKISTCFVRSCLASLHVFGSVHNIK
jgi:hypothetical protein